MLKNCKGYVLVDAMVGMLILLLTIAFITPLMMKAYQERTTIQQYHQAIQLTEDVLVQWVQSPSKTPTSITRNGTVYELRWEEINGIMKLCSNWEGENEREYSYCLYRKHL